MDKPKILNVFKANEKQIHANTEIETMIRAFGTGIGEDFNLEKLRYNKIIIAADADVDGEHIVTLFLTFMYKFMPELIKTGHVYLAKPPLYKLTRNKKDYYVYTENELTALRKKLGHSSRDSLQRYKGLGEMDADQLWETTMDPDTRTLTRVEYDETFVNVTEELFETLMGEKVEPRRAYIENNAEFATIDL